MRRFWRQALLAAGVLAGCFLVYGRLNISVLRAESGIYLNRGAGGPTELLHFATAAFARSYNGHYTPFAFDIELACAALFGPSAAPWQWRQMLYLSFFVLAALALWTVATARPDRTSRAQFLLPLGIATLFACSPLVIDLVVWPFMGMQILWAAMTTWSLYWLGRAVRGQESGEPSWRALSYSLAFAYGSLHCLGLGLATMAGYIAVILLLLGVARVRRAPATHYRRLLLLGGGALGLAAAHGSVMIFTLPKETPRAGFLGGAGDLLLQTLGYVSCVFYACARSLWSPNAWVWPRIDLLAQEWPYGAGVLLLLLLYLIHLWKRWRTRSDTELLPLCWHVFSSAAFGFGVLMIAGRVWKGEPWLGYLLGSRYLWPFAILCSGTLASLVASLRFRDRFSAPAFGLVLTGVCVTGNLVYQRQILPVVWPDSVLSHEVVWREIVTMTGELRAARLPLPNLSMKRLGEFDLPLQVYEPVLRRGVKLPRETTFDWIAPSAITPAGWAEMKRQSPALGTLAQTVFADTDRALAPPPTVLALTEPALLKRARLDHVKDHPNLGVPIDVGGDSKISIWIDPPTTLTFPSLPLGRRPVLRCFVAIHPQIWNDGGADGAVFCVAARVDGNTEVVAERYLNPIARPEERGWNIFEVDLSKYANRQVDLILLNTPGPSGNDYGDWCIWGAPTLSQ